MKSTVQESFLQQLIKSRNGYLVIACGSLILNLIFGIALISMIGREKIVLVPPEISKTFWVNKGEVSDEYLDEMSRFFVALRFNITPSNTESQREVLLRYISPEFYGSLKMQLIDEEKNIKARNINTSFYPADVRVNRKELATMVTGDLSSTVSNNLIPSQRMTFKIKYKYSGGKLLIRSFEEVKKS